MNKPHDWKVGDRFEVVDDVIGYKYSRTKAGTRGEVRQVYDTFLVVQLETSPHLSTLSLGLTKISPLLAATVTTTPTTQFAFKVGDWVTTPSIFGYGQITQIDTKPSIVNRFYVEFGGSGGSYWMHESELTLMPSTAANWTAPTTGNYHVSSTFNLPANTQINPIHIYRVADTHTPYSSETLRAERKAEGRCLECGDLLPMSSWGLGECPTHPTNTSAKQ